MLTRTDIATPAPSLSTAKPVVQLDGVTKRFGDAIALHEAWLKIAPGECMTLLGPSGCGKTTLLNLIAGFLDADGGEIFIDGALVTETPAHKREIGIVFQNYALFPHMTVANNIAYGLKTRGVEAGEIKRRVDEALALVKLNGFGDRKPRQLSGGQQQRVALARALVIRPKVLLLDEPFSALDKNLRASMQIELKEIQQRLGVTTVFVTHDQGEALSMSDRIAVMSAGRIRQIAAPQDIYCRPQDRFVASFIGDASVLSGKLLAVTDAVAQVAVGSLSVEVPAASLAGLAAGADVDLFVRPEHLVPVDGDGDATAPSLAGTVRTQVFQGGHVDLYIDLGDHAAQPVLLRSSAALAPSKWKAGDVVRVRPISADLVAFPKQDD
ncbi:ABC transporter ATP-binding protein [Rhizobium sp. LC145]|uniref:ABC transporter ATP-binding protein n=1 Tax=Rhizobium sp. LC145 TaxID=1120688 RepID=UPI00062A062A|nr:ABC transporter ATP-binding protein [Rhizobium sp. LC145]KKX26192.1 ABC transporter ATPase [Rhizobium sp. LC145]TKT67131.1 ABC transporter ATP-binding protein [Rhizobiaceae bacterium LC148]